jgi:hypothetical protein
LKLIKRLPMCTYNVCHDVSFCQCEGHTTWLDNNLLCLWLWWVLDKWGERLGSHAHVNDDQKKKKKRQQIQGTTNCQTPCTQHVMAKNLTKGTLMAFYGHISLHCHWKRILSSQLNKLLAVCHVFVFRMSANGWFTWIIWKKIMKMDIPWIFWEVIKRLKLFSL